MECSRIELVNKKSSIKLLEEESAIQLSNNEKYFLRLFVLNCDNQFISDFLEMRIKDLEYIKKTLKKKFKTKDWSVLIQEAFEFGFLEERDYINPAIKEIALDYASLIVNDFKYKPPAKYKLSKNVLFDFDKAFTKTIKSYFKMKQTDIVKLFNDKELTYLRLTYQGIDRDTIVEKLKLKNKRACTAIEKLILNKLSVNSLYNAYRLAFNLELLNREDFMMADIKKEASRFSDKITKILLSTKISDEEKELEVYLTLLVFQMKIEYSYLFKERRKGTVLQIV